MRTIDKIVPYKLSDEQIDELFELWIINGIWWEKWYNFNKLLSNILSLDYFKETKFKSLYDDILYLSYIHDINFYQWNTVKSFLRANYDFSLWVIQLLNWTSRMWRLSIFMWLFFWLNIFWIKYYNWKEKREVIHKTKKTSI